MSIIIRDAGLSDIPQIEAMEKLCFPVPWTPAMLRNQIEGEERVFLLAECGGVFAGYIGLWYVLDEGYITNVASSPEFRRRGVASALITEMISRAKKLELAFLTLEVRESNSAARMLYSKYGFTVEGRRKRYYEKPVEDAVLMTLFLK
ncbi:MAG: ribosomal-protein-alanine N-acetyltransferase [Clostridia bacterium]|nr:ribosomal-protein-alanine N-acetyltransferase [Clostridia bacterium]